VITVAKQVTTVSYRQKFVYYIGRWLNTVYGSLFSRIVEKIELTENSLN